MRLTHSLRTRLTLVACATVAMTGVTTGVTSATSTPAGVVRVTGSLDELRATRPGLDRLLSTGLVRGRAIVTLGAVPTSADVAALKSLGLVAQPLKALPLVLVSGPVAAVATAVASGVVADAYPDETLEYHDTASSNEMSSSVGAAKGLRAKGFTGKGVTVGVVDSGCDATHPDLADRVEHNVTLLSPEYVNAGTSPIIAIPIGSTPYNNTDLGSGHGTHVGGIIAADGTSGPDALGVAPDAKLACFAIGAVITTTAVVTAYDYMLQQPDMLGIDVVNNSWGNSFRQYDPADPVNVATKAVTKKGAVVVFSAGNSGSENGEASVSPFNQAPWVISVAASDLDRLRGDFSSNGLEFDNGKAVPIGPDGHTVIMGDRIGNTQPDVSGPGVDVSSSCDSTGTVIGPCPDHGNTAASGTSMSSPHVAGAAAVLLGANPALTPVQVQQALTATATPMVDEDGARLGSWQVGYGHVNLDKAVALVTGKNWKQRLKSAQQKAAARLARQDAWKVVRADLWQDDAPPLMLGGSYSTTRAVTVRRGVSALKVALVYPSPATAANLASVVATVRDSSGKVVGTTSTDMFYGLGVADVLVKGVKPGRYTIDVVGEYAVSDPDTIDSDSVNGRVVFLQVAQLARVTKKR